MKAKRKRKRLLSILLAIAMVVGMLPATSMTALAATLINNVTVLGVTEPKAGSVPSAGIYLGENVEVITDDTRWLVYDDTSGEYIDQKNAPFKEGDLHGACSCTCRKRQSNSG